MGNIWLFPSRMSAYGGATFLIPYVIFVVLIASTGVIGEMAFGRAASGGPVAAFGTAAERRTGRRGWGPHPGGGLSGHGHRLFRGGWLDFEVRRGVLYGRCAGEPRGGGIHRLFRHRGVLLGQHRLAGGRYGGHAAHHGPWHRRRHRAGQQGDDAPVLLPVRGAGHLHCHLARRGGRLPLHLCPEAGGTAGPHGMGLRSRTGVLLSVGGRERHPDLRVLPLQRGGRAGVCPDSGVL